jgi:hypothetical protein
MTLRITTPSKAVLGAITLSVASYIVVLSIVRLNVVILFVIRLNVVAPLNDCDV